jgi:hypothetical protein
MTVVIVIAVTLPVPVSSVPFPISMPVPVTVPIPLPVPSVAIAERMDGSEAPVASRADYGHLAGDRRLLRCLNSLVVACRQRSRSRSGHGHSCEECRASCDPD